MKLQLRDQTAWEQLRRVLESTKKSAEDQLLLFYEMPKNSPMTGHQTKVFNHAVTMLSHAEWALLQMDTIEAMRAS